MPFGPQTAQALDRYVRARRRQKLAAMKWFWISRRGHMQYTALYTTLNRRGNQVGVDVPAAHAPRHRRDAVAREGRFRAGLLTVAGWSSLEMAQRYVRTAEIRRAVEEAHKLGLGDI